MFASPYSLVPSHVKANITFRVTDRYEVVSDSVYRSNEGGHWVLCWIVTVLCFSIGTLRMYQPSAPYLHYVPCFQ